MLFLRKYWIAIVLLLASSSLSAQIISTFDANAQGWTTPNDADGTIGYSATGGNPGGMVFGNPFTIVLGATTLYVPFNFVAPVAYRGNRSAYYNGTLQYDIQQSTTGAANQYAEVTIADNSGITLYYFPTIPNQPAAAPGWSTYSVVLNNASGFWKTTNSATGPAASEVLIQSILSDLATLEIRGLYRDANTTNRLDNVSLSPPIVVTTQPNAAAVCNGITATFTTAAIGNPAITYRWQFEGSPGVWTDLNDGGGYSNVTTATLSINTTGNFGAGRYRCRISGTAVVDAFSNSATLAINALPLAPGATDGASCGTGTVTLTASGGVAGQYRWYTVPTGGTAIVGQTNATYTTPSLTVNTPYYVAINNGTCESTRTLVTAIINTLPSAPTTTGAAACGASSVTLSASGGSAGEYRWYTLASGGTPITGETNSTYTTGTITSSTTYYVSINNGSCESARTAVTASITPLPTAPITTGSAACGPSASITLMASGATNGEYRWYTAATGGTALTGEVNETFVTPAITATTTYYVAINNGSCESTRTAVTATINTTPAAPTTTGSAACGPSASITLTASGGTAGEYRWYSDATGGTAIAGQVNASFTTPSITTTTTYYVAINNGSCESSRTSVIATINSLPAKPVITLSGTTAICGGQSVTLTAPAGFTYLWSTGATTQQITVSNAGNFTVQVNNGTCQSVASDPAVITVVTCNQPPVITSTTATTNVEGNVTIDLSSLLSDPDDNLDLSSLRIIVPPKSGAVASIVGQSLVIDYSGVNFAGTDELTIEICDTNNACVQQQILIDVAGDIVAYNGISPNGDDKNAKFLIKYIDTLPDTRENKVIIFNRWGDPVWEGVNYNNTNVVFTGQNKNGNDLPTGTYFYKIEFASGKSSVTGYLSLKR